MVQSTPLFFTLSSQYSTIPTSRTLAVPLSQEYMEEVRFQAVQTPCEDGEGLTMSVEHLLSLPQPEV